jgi:hypothetical protein
MDLSSKGFKMNKHLIVSGCSFTEILSGHKAWPEWLVDKLNGVDFYSLSSSAMGSQGNGLISRGIIYDVSTKLKNGVDPKDILVGVQWSGSDRMDFLLDDDQIKQARLDPSKGVETRVPNPDSNWDGWMENPTGFIPGEPKKWVISNLGWKLAKDFYMKWHSPEFGLVMTLEHILRTQWFLERNNINYFMTTMNSKVMLPDDDPTTKHLYDQIDFTNFLPVAGMQEWAYGPAWANLHPSQKLHKKFAVKIIMPFLKERYKIN